MHCAEGLGDDVLELPRGAPGQAGEPILLPIERVNSHTGQVERSIQGNTDQRANYAESARNTPR